MTQVIFVGIGSGHGGGGGDNAGVPSYTANAGTDWGGPGRSSSGVTAGLAGLKYLGGNCSTGNEGGGDGYCGGGAGAVAIFRCWWIFKYC